MMNANSITTVPPEFISGKPRFSYLGSQVFTPGGASVRFLLEKVGLLDMLMVRVTGTYTVATAQLVNLPRAPYNIVQNFRLSPSGRQKIFDIGGWSLHLHNLRQRNWNPLGGPSADVNWSTNALDTNAGFSAVKDSFPTAVGAQTMTLYYVLPAHRSAYDPRGRIPVNNDKDTILYVTPNAAANLFTTPANFTVPAFTVDVMQVSYDPVSAVTSGAIQNGAFDTGFVVTYEETEQTAIIGENPVALDTGGIVLDSFHTVALNSSLATTDPTTGIDGFGFKVDTTDFVDRKTVTWPFYLRQRRDLSFAPPDGVLYLDWDEQRDVDGSSGKLDGVGYEPSLGRWLHLDQANQAKAYININAGATLGASPRIYSTYRRLERVRG